jgi:hypothetical protein
MSSDRAFLASASHDNSVKLWDLKALEDGSDNEDEEEEDEDSDDGHATADLGGGGTTQAASVAQVRPSQSLGTEAPQRLL